MNVHITVTAFSKQRAKGKLPSFFFIPKWSLYQNFTKIVCVNVYMCMLTHTEDQSGLWISMQNPSIKYHKIEVSSTLNKYMVKWGTSQERELGSVLEKLGSILDQKQKNLYCHLNRCQKCFAEIQHPMIYWLWQWLCDYIHSSQLTEPYSL